MDLTYGSFQHRSSETAENESIFKDLKHERAIPHRRSSDFIRRGKTLAITVITPRQKQTKYRQPEFNDTQSAMRASAAYDRMSQPQRPGKATYQDKEQCACFRSSQARAAASFAMIRRCRFMFVCIRQPIRR
jgi:hypothetical protein